MQYVSDEPEVEQGNIFDFCVHHSLQDEVQDPWHADLGIEELPRNYAKEAMESAREGMAALEFQDEDRPYGMTKEKHEEYKVQLEVFNKAEKPREEKVELHHVEKAHQHVEYVKAGRLEKDLLHIREDQLERRMNMLERIAAAAPQRPKNDLYSEVELEKHPEWRCGISPFMEKYLPVPLLSHLPELSLSRPLMHQSINSWTVCSSE